MTHLIVYPFFLEFSDFTFDDFWKEIFINCACDRFPRGVKYDAESHTLYVRTPDVGGRSKVEPIKLPSKPNEAYLSVINIFQEKLNIYSSSDLKLKRKELEESKENIKINLDCEWKQLKPRSLRDNFIMDYVISLGDEHSLPPKEVKRLFHLLHTGFQFKQIDSNNVQYANGKIISISGVKYFPEEKTFRFEKPSQRDCKNDKPKPNIKIFQSLDRFVREMAARQLKLT